MVFDNTPDESTLTRDQKIRREALKYALWSISAEDEDAEEAGTVDVPAVLSRAARFEGYIKFGTSDPE